MGMRGARLGLSAWAIWASVTVEFARTDEPAAAVPPPHERILTGDDAARAEGVTHVAFGDLFLEDVRAYRERQMAGTGLAPLFPLWGLDTTWLAREMIASGLRARLTTVDPPSPAGVVCRPRVRRVAGRRVAARRRPLRRARRVPLLLLRRPDVPTPDPHRNGRRRRARRLRLRGPDAMHPRRTACLTAETTETLSLPALPDGA